MFLRGLDLHDMSVYILFNGAVLISAASVIILISAASVIKRPGFLATDQEVRIRFSALPGFLGSNKSGTGSTQPGESN
jgi:hypothetical protein